MLASLIKLMIILPLMALFYTIAFLAVCFIFIIVALVVSAPFIFIIGIVLWIFF